MSSGATVRRSITSTEIPSSATASAAATASCTIRDTETSVMSVPARTTADLADRDDVVRRRLWALHAVQQAVLDEDHRVRVLDRRPQQAVRVGRASTASPRSDRGCGRAGPRGSASAGCPDDRPAPNCVRTVSAIVALPPVMNGIFAAWLSNWSRHTPTKSKYMISTTGRIPAIAAPTPRPTIAVSEIGVSRTRSPNWSWSPRVSPNTLPPVADVDRRRRTPGRRSPTPSRGRRGSRPSCGRPARRRAAGRLGMLRARAHDVVGRVVATSGRAAARAASTASSRSLRDGRFQRPDPVGGRPRRTRAGGRGRRAGRAPSRRRPRCSVGTAAGRPRSDRASGTWSPRRSSGRRRRARHRPRPAIAAAVAVTSLPSTAT